jgi:hypothetical protein
VPLDGQAVWGVLDEPFGNCEALASDSSDIGRVEFYLDGVLTNTERYVPYSCTIDTTRYPDGPHTIRAKAYDRAGNVSQASVSVVFDNYAADQTPPSLGFRVPLGGQAVSGLLDEPLGNCEALALDAGGIDRVDFYLDGVLTNTERYVPYSCTIDTPRYPDGLHTITAKGYDHAGNVSEASVSVVFDNYPADTTPLETTITAGPSGTTTATDASFSFSSSESGSNFECRLDGGGWASCSSPKSYSGLAAGTHTFEVRAMDQAENVDATPASRSWTISTSSSSSGTTYYVSTGGSDSNPGTQSAPWRTIGRAASSVSSAGSKVVVMGGSYSEDVTLSKAGAADRPISFQADGSAAVNVRSFRIAASRVAVEGFNIAGASGRCVTIDPGLTDVRVAGNEISNCGSHGIGFRRPEDTGAAYSNNVTVSGNRIHGVGKSYSYGNDITVYADNTLVADNDLTDTPNDAIEMWGDRLTFRHNNIHDISNTLGHHNDAFQTWVIPGDGSTGKPLTNLVIERNTIRNVTGSNSHGIMAEGTTGHRDWDVRSNVWDNVGSYTIILGCCGSNGIENVRIYNNTFAHLPGGIVIQYQLGSTGTVANNIFYATKNPVYVSGSSGASATHAYNLFAGGTPALSETHRVAADPLFVNSASNYHLTASSPAIDAGDNGALVPVRSQDLDGNPTARAVDIGAYEAP